MIVQSPLEAEDNIQRAPKISKEHYTSQLYHYHQLLCELFMKDKKVKTIHSLKSNFQFNQVTKIKWGTVTREQRPRALVICSDGTSYKADYVIVALPLGVLKSEMDTLFCPGLPAAKTNAIQKMTLLHKVNCIR